MLPYICLILVAVASANPQGYNYPAPSNPLTFPVSTTTPPPPPPPPVEYLPPLDYLPPVAPDSSANVAVLLPPEEKPMMEMLLWDYRESIPGEPETDYPILDKIPVTAFTCDGRLTGYYADVETRCQVFHVCTFLPEGEAIKNSFLCPNGTLFNQENFACQWWADVNCPTSDQFFKLNENIGKVPEKTTVKRQTFAPSHVVAQAAEHPAAAARSSSRSIRAH